MRPSRQRTVFHGTEIIEVRELDVDWETVRQTRNKALSVSDWRFMSDQSPSDEWVAYRVFLRDLPQNHPDSANEAADAWNDYEIPEGA